MTTNRKWSIANRIVSDRWPHVTMQGARSMPWPLGQYLDNGRRYRLGCNGVPMDVKWPMMPHDPERSSLWPSMFEVHYLDNGWIFRRIYNPASTENWTWDIKCSPVRWRHVTLKAHGRPTYLLLFREIRGYNLQRPLTLIKIETLKTEITSRDITYLCCVTMLTI